jgi:hypothetical protein
MKSPHSVGLVLSKRRLDQDYRRAAQHQRTMPMAAISRRSSASEAGSGMTVALTDEHMIDGAAADARAIATERGQFVTDIGVARDADVREIMFGQGNSLTKDGVGRQIRPSPKPSCQHR